jgi:hypothetical protein
VNEHVRRITFTAMDSFVAAIVRTYPRRRSVIQLIRRSCFISVALVKLFRESIRSERQTCLCFPL